MAYVSIADLNGLGQDSQQSWWDWFFSGSSDSAPQTAYQQNEASFNQQRAGATPAPSKAWGGEAYEAPPVEDISVMAPQGSDSAEALSGLGQDGSAPAVSTTPPVTDDSHILRNAGIVAGALALGGLAAFAYDWIKTPRERGRLKVMN